MNPAAEPEPRVLRSPEPVEWRPNAATSASTSQLRAEIAARNLSAAITAERIDNAYRRGLEKALELVEAEVGTGSSLSDILRAEIATLKPEKHA